MDKSLPDLLADPLLGSLGVVCQEIKSELPSETVPDKIEYGEGEKPPDSKADVLELKLNQQGVDVERMCKYCNFSASKQAMMKHMRTHMEKRFKCSWCSKTFRSRQAWLNHENAHAGKKPFDCEHCGMEFTTKGEMVRHIGYKHSKLKPHKCPWPYCSYSAVERARLKRHQVIHTEERPFQCRHCSYAAPLKVHLKRHVSNVHRGEQPYECDICHTRFTQQGSMAWHRKKHTGERPVFKCPHCPSVLGRKYDLRQHIIKLHTSDRLHQCRKCGKIFSDPYSLKIHKRSHKGQKCFKCGVCNFAAAVVQQLECHMRKHTKQKPFKCDDCGKNYRQNLGLKMHRQRKHNLAPESEKFVCEECNSQFLRRGSLKNHMVKFHHYHPRHASEFREKTVEKEKCSGVSRYEYRGSSQQDNKDIVGVMTDSGGATGVSKDSFKVKKVKGGKQRGKRLSKPEVNENEEVEEMWTEVIRNSGEDVEEDHDALVANKEMVNGLSENVSCEEKTLGAMKRAFEYTSSHELEEPSLKLMEEYIILLTDLPVIELNFDEGDVEFDDSGIVMDGTSGDVDGLEEETFLEDPGEWKSEKEKDLATCFGFDEWF